MFLWCCSGASHSMYMCVRGVPDLTGEGTNSGRGGGLFQSGLLCPCKLNFMYVCVCVCTPVNLNYTFIFMICIHLYLLFSSVCVYVCACICGKRESNHEQTVCVASGYNLRGNSGSLWQLCPCKLNFMCVCVSTPVNLCIINYKFIFMICIHL